MPLRRLTAQQAFDTLKENPVGQWPRRDAPDDRFALYADPAFRPRFRLEPGQRIFTIGSCFARGVERTLADRGFDIPTLAFQDEKLDWGGNPSGYLNNYVPPAIAPQIRWAFGMERFELELHAAEASRGRWVDMQLHTDAWPAPPEAVLQRREALGGMYRMLADSHVVLITLGLIEAWYDNRSRMYVNRPPPKGLSRREPDRFELHVLDYNDVTRSLEDLVALLDQVCPSDWRMILTVSPVPLTATFDDSDVAVASAYGKAVLRAAVQPFIANRPNIEYFPSYESVVLTDRSLAFEEDQIHINQAMVRFNVDRMIRRYAAAVPAESVADLIEETREAKSQGMAPAAFKRLQQAWIEHPDDPKLAVALARQNFRAGNGVAAEKLLVDTLARVDDVTCRVLLATWLNESGRHQEAAAQMEHASVRGRPRPGIALQRAIACYHLGRVEEGLAVLEAVRIGYSNRAGEILYWIATMRDELGRHAEAEDTWRKVTSQTDDARISAGYAAFLARHDRWPEVAPFVDKALLANPMEPTALGLRAELRKRGLTTARGPGLAQRVVGQVAGAVWRASPLLRRTVGAAVRTGNASLDD